jgi:hypothetical protein
MGRTLGAVLNAVAPPDYGEVAISIFQSTDGNPYGILLNSVESQLKAGPVAVKSEQI